MNRCYNFYAPKMCKINVLFSLMSDNGGYPIRKTAGPFDLPFWIFGNYSSISATAAFLRTLSMPFSQAALVV